MEVLGRLLSLSPAGEFGCGGQGERDSGDSVVGQSFSWDISSLALQLRKSAMTASSPWGRSPATQPDSHISGNPTSGRKSSGSPWGSSRLPGNCSLPIPDNLLSLLFPLSPAEEEAAQTAVELGLSRAEMH